MKRIVPVILVLVLCLVLMVVPAFADSVPVASSVDGTTLEYASDSFVLGTYYMTVTCEIYGFPDLTFVNVPVELEESDSGMYYFSVDLTSYFVDAGQCSVTWTNLSWSNEENEISLLSEVDEGAEAAYVLSLYLYSSPYVPEPGSTEGLVDSVSGFFSGLVVWMSDIVSFLIENPLCFVIVVAMTLIGFGVWGLNKLKKS